MGRKKKGSKVAKIIISIVAGIGIAILLLYLGLALTR